MHASPFSDGLSENSESRSPSLDEDNGFIPDRDGSSEASPSLCLYADCSADSSGNLKEDEPTCTLIRSFDAMFRLNQRAADIALLIDKMDRLILSSRSVESFSDRILCALENELDLITARILIRENHQIASILEKRDVPGLDKLPAGFLESEGFHTSGTFVLDDPAGELSTMLFRGDASYVASAAAARLCTDDEAIGLLCLASDDPARYCGDANADVVAALAERIALGLKNAWDHERGRAAELYGTRPGLFSRVLFEELLNKEWQRSIRYGSRFSLAAISWQCTNEDEGPLGEQVLDLLIDNFRSCDIGAQGDRVKLWILLPNTDENRAIALVKRLFGFAKDCFEDRISLQSGIAGMSERMLRPAELIEGARTALKKARSAESEPVVVQGVPDARKPSRAYL